MIQAKKQKTEAKEKKPSVDKDQRTDKLCDKQIRLCALLLCDMVAGQLGYNSCVF